MLQFSPTETPFHHWVGPDPVIWVIECEVERHWPRHNPPDIVGPAVAPRTERQIIAAMEELVLLLVRPQDIVILRSPPDRRFLEYLRAHGLGHCRILAIQRDDPMLDICELIRHDRCVLAALAAHPIRGHPRFLFYGATAAADRLVRDTGIPSIGAPCGITHYVNDKCFSSCLTGLPNTIPSQIARSPEQLRDMATMFLRETRGKILLKDPMGVSGRGIRALASETELQQYMQYLDRRCIENFVLIVETFIEKKCDLNYQFFLHPFGRVSYYLYKEALVSGHKHLGHFTPAIPDPDIDSACRSAAEIIGQALANAGYKGVVGVDGLVAQDGTIYPLLEINARLNNSSFQWSLDQARQRGLCLLSSQLAFTLQYPATFAEFHDQVVDRLHCRADEEILVMNWAPVARLQNGPARTRLMYAVLASTRYRCLELQQMFEKNADAFFAASHSSSHPCNAYMETTETVRI